MDKIYEYKVDICLCIYLIVGITISTIRAINNYNLTIVPEVTSTKMNSEPQWYSRGSDDFGAKVRDQWLLEMKEFSDVEYFAQIELEFNQNIVVLN